MGQIATWVKGTLFHRFGRLLGGIIGVALTVAFIASLGEFLTASKEQLTRRAIHDVPVDWQIQTAPGVDPGAVRAQIEKMVAPRILHQVFYASVDGFRASTGGTVQTTGAGKALGMSEQYVHDFPRELRPLLGPAETGVRVAQQLAANLHVTIGDSVQILRVGLPPATVKVDGVVDLPYADSLFQAVGVPPGIAPQAPPDNVIILPDALWRTLFQPQALIRPDSVRTQFHARLGHTLPSSPTASYLKVTHEARNLEARIAGSGIVGDNLGTRLLSVTSDSLYAQVLFLFLGLPGMILAIVLTLAVAASGGQRRASEQTLLRVRGASVAQILRLETANAIVAGVGGLVIGSVLALAASRMQGIGIPALVPSAPGWIAGASLAGLALALGAVVVPAWIHARQSTVAAARQTVKAASRPLWQRMWLDVIILAIGAVELWRTASTGYAVVLAPEGVAANSVNYEAFIAPVCLWIGGVLLSYRLLDGGLHVGRRALSRLLAPLARSLADLVAVSLSRQRGLMTRGTVLVALAVAFAVSTAVFDTTYNGQSRVDAQLTNGSDVTVTGPTGAAPSSKLAQLQAIPGVVGVQTMQHRFAYVGNDLQDMFGINPRTIGEATKVSNAFFSSGNAKATLDSLARTSDGVLVSEETRATYQLNPGDATEPAHSVCCRSPVPRGEVPRPGSGSRVPHRAEGFVPGRQFLLPGPADRHGRCRNGAVARQGRSGRRCPEGPCHRGGPPGRQGQRPGFRPTGNQLQPDSGQSAGPDQAGAGVRRLLGDSSGGVDPGARPCRAASDVRHPLSAGRERPAARRLPLERGAAHAPCRDGRRRVAGCRCCRGAGEDADRDLRSSAGSTRNSLGVPGISRPGGCRIDNRRCCGASNALAPTSSGSPARLVARYATEARASRILLQIARRERRGQSGMKAG